MSDSSPPPPPPPTAHSKVSEFPCGQCGAKLTFTPGTQTLTCAYCGHENAVPKSMERVEELDYISYLLIAERDAPMVEETVVKCSTCAAETVLAARVTATHCAFCGGAIVVAGASRQRIKPRSLLPFAIDRDRASGLFRSWVGSLWFAPSDLKKRAQEMDGMSGLYLPYWTYDSDTRADYSGQRGDDYTETQHYTTKDEKGNTVQRTRQVTKTRWRHASGRVYVSFNDLLILASDSLPRPIVEKLEPWDLQHLVPYDDSYLSGFSAESYQVQLPKGFEMAKQMMDSPIRREVCRDIGGDHQRISSLDVAYSNIAFKHILLPVWLHAYRYQDKTFRIFVNARTGEIQGERPYSVVKIVLFVLFILALVLAVVAVASSR